MKYLLVFIILLTANTTLAQPIISLKTVILHHDAQTDTLRIPIVSDKYPALKNALSYKNLFDGDDLPDVIKNYASCGCGITGLSYEVTYQSNNVLSIILYFQTMAAYPDDYQKYLTFDVNTGKVYPIANEINERGLDWVFNSYKTTLRQRLIDDKYDTDEQSKDAYETLKTAIDGLNRDELLGKYVFTKDGVLFSIEKILPHAAQSLEPNRDLWVPYRKLKSYKTSGAVVLK